MPRAGRLLRSNQTYREPVRVANTVDGFHFVPTYTLGQLGRLDVPTELRQYVATIREPSLSWTSYRA